MKANEFVRKFGINDAKCCILNCANPEDRWLMRRGDLISDDAFDDLKRLVESHELIEKDFESVEMAEYEYMVSDSYSDPYWVRVKQAIADVESLKEVS